MDLYKDVACSPTIRKIDIRVVIIYSISNLIDFMVDKDVTCSSKNRNLGIEYNSNWNSCHCGFIWSCCLFLIYLKKTNTDIEYYVFKCKCVL